jgi:hypothetical protein
MKEAEKSFQAVKDASDFGRVPGSTSIVDRLVDNGWCTEDDLVLAYEDLRKPDLDRVTVLFQLPFVLKLPDKWLKVRSEYGNPYVRFRPKGSNGLSEEAIESNVPTNSTQVLISFQLWDKRRQQYTTYLEALNNPRGLVKTKLKSSGVLNAAVLVCAHSRVHLGG